MFLLHHNPIVSLRARLSALLALALCLAARPAFPCPAGAAHDGPSAASPEPRAVKVTMQREGEQTRCLVENNEFCEITLTIEMNLVNLRGTASFPYTATFPPHQTTEAFVLAPAEPGARWEFSYTNYYKLGSHCARHDDSCIYQLPYAAGAKFHVTQAYNGKFSHTGANQYAVDWEMPEGTPVHAARGGVVVKAKDDSNTGGSSMKYDRFNNFVLIRHADGTLGHYCHLKQGGVCVAVGQTVQAGDLIAHSGNTGFSSGPHLHFCVFKTRDGRQRESIPVKFRTTKAGALTLLSGRSYKAAPLPVGAPAEPPPVSQQASATAKSHT